MVVEISTIEQLQAIKDDPAGSYILTADIDASATAGWNGGLGFEPIQGFSGTLNGNGKSVVALSISRSVAGTGLFGGSATSTQLSGHIYDLHLSGMTIVNIGPFQYCAGIASDSRGRIERCRVSGTINNGSGWYTAGIVGRLRNGGEVRDCYNSSVVYGGSDPRSSGIVGRAESGSLVERCHNVGGIFRESDVVGGGCVGDSSGTIVDCFWDSDKITNSLEGGAPKTTAEMQNIGTYVGWDIVAARDRTRTWGIDGGYPFLQVFNGDPIPGMIGGEIAYWKCDEGSGSLLRDSVGGFHGTTVGGVGWAANPGITKFRNPYYVSFGSNRPRVIVPTPILTPTQTSTAWSCTAWVYPMAVGSGPNRSIMGAAGPSANDRGTWVLRLNIDRHLEFFLNHPGNTFHTVPEAFPEEVWSHVGCTYDGTTLKIYHNGEEKLSVLQQFDSVIPGQFWIGDRNSSTNASWSGGLDELRVFSRTLSQDEMSSLAAGGPNPRRYDPFRSHVFHSHRIGGVA